MVQLAEDFLCTACGACAAVCPKKCISMEERKFGGVFPVINKQKCIKCHSCEKNCPILQIPTFEKNINAYAASSTDEEQRRTSASGGIAYALYEKAIDSGFVCVGASLNSDFSVTHKLAKDYSSLFPYKNSKYVFSDAYGAYPFIKDLLKNKQKVLFIGLPCQVAALKKMFPKVKELFLVDIVCHGSVPTNYLKQHIAFLEKKLKNKAVNLFFRDPTYGTSSYYFSLYNKNGECFYCKRTIDGELYNYGFHKMITYRENCYNCRFARPERISDLTLGDFHGNGDMRYWNDSHSNVSVIITHTNRAESLIHDMQGDNLLKLEPRSLEEVIAGDRQLREPSPKTHLRLKFEKKIVKNNYDFEKTMYEIFKFEQRCWKCKGRRDKIVRILKRFIGK